MSSVPDMRSFSSLMRVVARSFTVMAWGSGTVKDWHDRCEHSQRLSERRRVSAARARRRRAERRKDALAGILLAIAAVWLLIMLKVILGA